MIKDSAPLLWIVVDSKFAVSNKSSMPRLLMQYIIDWLVFLSAQRSREKTNTAWCPRNTNATGSCNAWLAGQDAFDPDSKVKFVSIHSQRRALSRWNYVSNRRCHNPSLSDTLTCNVSFTLQMIPCYVRRRSKSTVIRYVAHVTCPSIFLERRVYCDVNLFWSLIMQIYIYLVNNG